MVPEPSVLPEPEDVPIPDADDLVCSRSSPGDKKRVEVKERKMTDEDRKLFRRTKEAELQLWLDHKAFDVVNKKVADKGRVMRSRWVLTWKSTGKAKGRLCVLEVQEPDLTENPRDSPRLFVQAEALVLQCVASNKW